MTLQRNYINYLLFLVPKNYKAPKFLENLRAVMTPEGLVSFECKVVGYPTPQLEWLKDGRELKPGDVYQLTGTRSLGMNLNFLSTVVQFLFLRM